MCVLIYTQALQSLQQQAGTALVPVVATSLSGLAHGDRPWGDPNSLSHGILVMGDSSGPQGESCLCGAGSGLMPSRGYWGSLSCRGSLCAADGRAPVMEWGKWGRKRLGFSLQTDDPPCSFGCMWSSFLSQQSNTR